MVAAQEAATNGSSSSLPLLTSMDDHVFEPVYGIVFGALVAVAVSFAVQAVAAGDVALLQTALTAAAVGGFFGYRGAGPRAAASAVLIGVASAMSSVVLGMYLYLTDTAVQTGIRATWIDTLIALAAAMGSLHLWSKRRRSA